MGYKPRPESDRIIKRAWAYVQSVDYAVTARWVFYRLLQDGTYIEKKGYKHLLALLSKARKEFYENWRPWTLSDDTRAPLLMQRTGYYGIHLRGDGFDSEEEWLGRLNKELNCPLNRWANQSVYIEIWFEAAAMQGQFAYYANENIPLLAFHGDVSIPEKWRAAKRLAAAWFRYKKPIKILYYGDYDEKGLIIPSSAWHDIELWTYSIVANKGRKEAQDFYEQFSLTRVGINEGQIDELGIPENPEKPGTYQWEALDDEQAQSLIGLANEPLDITAFDRVESEEAEIIKRLKTKLEQQ